MKLDDGYLKSSPSCSDSLGNNTSLHGLIDFTFQDEAIEVGENMTNGLSDEVLYASILLQLPPAHQPCEKPLKLC